MKRIISIVLATLLALSLFACRTHTAGEAEQPASQETAEPAPEPTPEPEPPTAAETLRAAIGVTNGANSGHASIELSLAANIKTGGRETVYDADREASAGGTLSADRIAVTAQIEADYMKSPRIIRGTVRFTLSENSDTDDYTSDPADVSFCLWEKDGISCYAACNDAARGWVGSGSSIGSDIGSAYLTDLYAFIDAFAEQFVPAGEEMVNGETATVYEALIEGEPLRERIEMFSDKNGEPLLTFSDELLPELPGIRYRIAVSQDGSVVREEIDAAAFAAKLIMRILSAESVLPEGSGLSIETLRIRITMSDLNAVGPVEPPEDVSFNAYSSGLSILSDMFGR